MTQFTDGLVAACNAEYARWDNGGGRETWGTPQHGKDYYLFVKDYWKSIGNNQLDGRTVVEGIRPAWSSAFVSYCVKTGGAGTKFFYTEAHCHYVKRAMDQASGAINNFGYRARKTNAYKPKIGDIVVGGREYAMGYTYDQAAMVYQADSFYPSHGDIIIDITPTYALTTGGNINDNVDRKRLK
ncbi:MAG: DUF2272 domain-containing protein, partial [Rhizobiaceae bacterium]|nr:DUF2272 domain-containing protein [Rhizobiaceae bacterium]